MIQHEQGIFGLTHLILCDECAKAMLRRLPPELKAVIETPENPHMPKEYKDKITALPPALEPMPEPESAKFIEVPTSVEAEILEETPADILKRIPEASMTVEPKPAIIGAPETKAVEETKAPKEVKPDKPEEKKPAADAQSPDGGPFVCDVCGRWFTTRLALTGHMKTHSKASK